jgi:hypothetical protein
VQETYQRATQSSNLKPTRCGVRGDLDVVGAAAFVPESLGMLLFRLVGEYDRARGEKALYEIEAARLYQLLPQMRRQLEAAKSAVEAQHDEKHNAHVIAMQTRHVVKLTREIAWTADEAKRETTTGRAMVLLQLTSLHSAKQLVGELAVRIASTYTITFDHKVLMHLAGRVLDVFLDPKCPQCTGRMFSGGSHRGEMKVICRGCKGSGHRRDDLGHTEMERHLASRILVELSRKVGYAEKCLRAALRDNP